MKKMILVFIAMGIIFGLFYYLNKNKKEIISVEKIPAKSPSDVSLKPAETKPKEICFAKFGKPNQDSDFDRYTLRLIVSGEKVTGELNFLPTEKDRKTGEITGTVSAASKASMTRNVSIWWFNFAEGISVKEEVKIIFDQNSARIGLGEMVEKSDGVFVYKNPKNISYGLELPGIACGDLIKRGVESE